MAPEIIPTPSGTGVFSSGVPLRPKSRPCKHGGNLSFVLGMAYTVSAYPTNDTMQFQIINLKYMEVATSTYFKIIPSIVINIVDETIQRFQ